MNVWNINNEVSSRRASITLRSAWGGGRRYEPDSIPGLVTAHCVTGGIASLRFHLEELFGIAVHTEQDCLGAGSTSSVNAGFVQVT